jgi:hypothetical protein
MRFLPPCVVGLTLLLGSTAMAQTSLPSPATANTPPPGAPPAVSAPPPAGQVPAPLSPELITTEGYPRTLHLQLTRHLNQPYSVRVISGGNTLSCPFPLSPAAGCDLSPVKAGDAQYTVTEGSRDVHSGILSIPPLGGTMKLTREPEEWMKRLGYSLTALGGFALVTGGALWGIDHYGPDDTAAQITMAISVPIIVVGVLLAVLPRAPELRSLSPDDVLVPAPAPPPGGSP